MEKTHLSIIRVFCSAPLISNILLLCMNIAISFGASLPTTPLMRNETDRLALLSFKSLVIDDPLGTLSLWNDSLHFCQWYGVICSRQHQRVKVLDLQSRKLTGELSPFIGNLTFLQVINLRNNSFTGHIPPEVGNLFLLQELHLQNNSFDGKIPANLSGCSRLKLLRLSSNNLFGIVPSKIGSLSNLVRLSLRSNNLTGAIPPSLGNLSLLELLSLGRNDLREGIPDSLGQLSSLTFLGLGINKLSGIIPPSLYNLSSLNTFSLPLNQLYGTLPQDLGLKLPNLVVFNIAENKFSGTIPVSFPNASRLFHLDVGRNRFSGSVPINLGDLAGLQKLSIQSNNLGTRGVDDLSFIISLTNCSNLKILSLSNNQFGCQLPKSVANLTTQLETLYLGGNQISGSIPTGIENLVNLYALGMESNLLTGSIPTSIGKLQKLQGLYLRRNKLTGEIPFSLRNITRLSKLYLNRNYLNGSIPSSLKYCQHLQWLDLAENELEGNILPQVITLPSLIVANLSNNFLMGSLPLELGKLKSLGVLDISHNKLSGKIPRAIGDCSGLEYLFMQRNSFSGSIPLSMASLRGIQYLDLSHNNLSGKIPQDLQNLPIIQILNLSFNDLEGIVPVEGVFNNSSAIIVTGNIKLCGGIPNLKLLACLEEDIKKHGISNTFVKVITTFISVTLFLTLATCFVIFHWRRKARKDPPPTASLEDSYIRLSYDDLLKATEGFAPTNLIGKGIFGDVYKGTLPPKEMLIAVKVLNLQDERANMSFMVECEAFKKIRHRNLLKIITSCSSVDFKGNDFKALVLEFMPNGSLENWLHPNIDGQHQLKRLNMNQRLNIAIDIASALDYLHHQCEAPLVHRDLKPSNVLLDDDMNAHVGDFGLAKFLSKSISNSRNNVSRSIAIKGSIGYIAPEYGMGGQVSTKGDVYSYGILLLETFTGKRPTDDVFINGSSLHEISKMALLEHVMGIVDPNMLIPDQEREQDEAMESFTNISHGKRDCLVSIVRIGVACSMESPQDRMDIQDVIRELHSIKNVYHRVTEEENRIRP